MIVYFADAQAVTSLTSAVSVVLLVSTLLLGALNIRNKYEKGRDSESLQNLKDSVDAFTTRRLADQLVIDTKNKEIQLLTQKAEVLEKHVTQAPDISKLATQMLKQHTEAMTAIKDMTRELGNVAKAISKEAS